jgi:hypothetical protein
MLSYYLSFVSASVYALADFIESSSQTGILVTLGSLLFVLGTVLRRNLPAAEETTSPHPAALWADAMPLKAYVGTVDGVANATASRKHGSAVLSHPGFLLDGYALDSQTPNRQYARPQGGASA